MSNILTLGKEFANSSMNKAIRTIKSIPTHPITISTKNTVSLYFDETFKWCGRGIKLIGSIPHHMQSNKCLAFSVIFTLNSIFFFVISKIANSFENNLESDSKSQECFKRRFVDYGIVGLGAFAFNYCGLNKLLNYRQKTITILFTATLMIIFRPTREKNNINPEEPIKVF